MGAKILVIDDDQHLAKMIQDALEGRGHQVVVGYDGQMALSLARRHKPHLMVMDVNMPMTSGIKALEFLRQSPDTRDIPVIFLSGAASDTVYPTLEKNQRVAFLKKPLDLEELDSIVRHFLEKYPRP
jgi:CheY-like chemotaxis protein